MCCACVYYDFKFGQFLKSYSLTYSVDTTTTFNKSFIVITVFWYVQTYCLSHTATNVIYILEIAIR